MIQKNHDFSDLSSLFPTNYIISKNRFKEAVINQGYYHQSYFINQFDPSGQELTIDVGISDSPHASKVVIISSGLHGVEGFLGSAIQLALLGDNQFTKTLAKDIKIVLIHALNPYGFAWKRRCNEDNVDLNRNFLLPEEDYQGIPENYLKLNYFINPNYPPSLLEPFLLKAVFLILRYGMSSLMNTLPIGQYDYPKGLFYGGCLPSKTQQILAQYLPQWIGNITKVTHIDIHTGLGQWGSYKLLFSGSNTSESFDRLVQLFGADVIETFTPGGTAYQSRGSLELWCQVLIPQCSYDFVTAEFGTYSAIKVFQALRAENQAYWWGKAGKNYDWTKNQLVEMFSPQNKQWREKCIIDGIKICKQACYGTF